LSRQKTFFQPEQPWELALTSGDVQSEAGGSQ